MSAGAGHDERGIADAVIARWGWTAPLESALQAVPKCHTVVTNTSRHSSMSVPTRSSSPSRGCGVDDPFTPGAYGCSRAVGYPRFGEDAVDVLLDGAFGVGQALGDDRVAHAVGDPPQHLELACGQCRAAPGLVMGRYGQAAQRAAAPMVDAAETRPRAAERTAAVISSRWRP
jgi:hypothetical protein